MKCHSDLDKSSEGQEEAEWMGIMEIRHPKWKALETRPKIVETAQITQLIYKWLRSILGENKIVKEIQKAGRREYLFAGVRELSPGIDTKHTQVWASVF